MRNSAKIVKTGAVLVLAATVLTPRKGQVHAAAGTLLRYHWVVGQHFASIETDTTTTAIKLTPRLPGVNSTSVEVDRYSYTTAATVTHVFSDGSGLLRLTFSKVSITKDGKTRLYPLKGYAVLQQIGTTGTVHSKKTVGGGSFLSVLPSNVTDPTPLLYPKAPVAVGGTWQQMWRISNNQQRIEHLQLQAVGSARGSTTATIRVTIQQPLQYTIDGTTFAGPVSGAGSEMVFVDTGADACAAHLSVVYHARVHGTLWGRKIVGSMIGILSESSTPIN